MTRNGLGDTPTFDWLSNIFPISAIDQNVVIEDPTGSPGFINGFLDDLSYWTGLFGSTTLSKNLAPVANPNYTFQGATTVVPGGPIIDSSGNLVAPPVNLIPTLTNSGQNSSDFQTNTSTVAGPVDSSFSSSGGTPSTSSTLIIWLLIGAGAILILKK